MGYSSLPTLCSFCYFQANFGVWNAQCRPSTIHRSCVLASLMVASAESPFKESFPLLPPALPCRGHIGMLDVKRGSRNRRREQRRVESRTGTRKKKTHTNFNYAFTSNRNKGLFTGQQQRVLLGKSTQLVQLTRGTSQRKWWCVNGAVWKEKYGMRVAYHLTWLALAVSSHSV